MPFAAVAKNLMLDALRGTNPTTPITHVGLAQKGSNFSVTGNTAGVFTATGHGFAAGDVVLFSGLTGGTPELLANQPYYVIATNLAANTFSVSPVSGGAQLTLSTALTAGTVNKLTELSGGAPAYARGAITFAASVNGLIDDSTNGVTLNVPGGATVHAITGYNGASAGTLLAVSVLASPEAYAAQGTYQVTDAKFDLNS